MLPEAWIRLYKMLFPGDVHPKRIIAVDNGLERQGDDNNTVAENNVNFASASLPLAQEGGPSPTEKAEPVPSAGKHEGPSPSHAGEGILFNPKRRYYSVSVRMFLAVLTWDVIGTPRVAKPNPGDSGHGAHYNRFQKRKVRNVDPFGLEFYQSFFNTIAETLGDNLDLKMPCPFRLFDFD